MLDALGISPTSQTLVFSQTSFQAERVGFHTPRAIFFNDNAAVGWVRGTTSSRWPCRTSARAVCSTP